MTQGAVTGALTVAVDQGSNGSARAFIVNLVGTTRLSIAQVDGATFIPGARTSGVASYFSVATPADTGITASTESIGINFATGTRAWATTGTVALQREIFMAGPTYASASASQTFTDPFTLYLTPPVAGANAIFTRRHTLGIVDPTSATSSITGGLIIATTLGTTATSVGIGGGNINAGGTLTVGGATTLTGRITTYNAVASAGEGVAPIRGAANITAQTTNATITSYANPAADADYEVSAQMSVTASTTLTTTLTVTYTDVANVSRTMILPVAGVSGTYVAAGAITGAGATIWHTPVTHIRAKASTTITILTSAGTFTGVTYSASGVIKKTS